MFHKVLIANRGEIACRVIESCHRLGVTTVAVYSDADAAAKHVAMADEAVRLGPAPAAESYLRGDLIIAAAQTTGAQGIHPGYGFLSENPDFVDAVEAAGLTFIGPSARAIRAMGLKDAAKRLMDEAGVPVVPGYHGAEQDPDLLAGEAAKIGYPVLIKARAGGGGKGMRKVDDPADFASALVGAQREGQAAFGDPAVLIEKWITGPRHIEIQVFGDGTHAIHLGERDCSLQRRHQKVIEEAPAPGMTHEMRAAMGAAAVRAAEAIGYSGAGTVEFIVDGSDGLHPDRFWFMEMNTRLQVEHPVTEMVTGLDLVELQLRVASGEKLPLAQDDVSLSGHAFEARIYAEDVPKGFLPAIGTLTHLSFPDDARADSGVRAGDTISPYYDPMIAKLIVHGPTRGAALNMLHRALSGTRIAGSVTNLAFLAQLCRDPDFAQGDVDTGLIERNIDDLTAEAVAPSEVVAIAALAALGLAETASGHQGFSLWHPLSWQVMLDMAGEPRTAHVTVETRGRFTVDLGEETVALSGIRRDGLELHASGTTYGLAVAGAEITVFDGATSHTFNRLDPLLRDGEAAVGSDTVIAPMPGLVKQVSVTAAGEVTAGDTLFVLEAMKMEHTLKAPRAGRIAALHVTEGDQVEDGSVLLELEPEDG